VPSGLFIGLGATTVDAVRLCGSDNILRREQGIHCHFVGSANMHPNNLDVHARAGFPTFYPMNGGVAWLEE
jgi:hypothetical protein